MVFKPWYVKNIPFNGCAGPPEYYEDLNDALKDIRGRLEYRKKHDMECELLEGTEDGVQIWECNDEGLMGDLHGTLSLQKVALPACKNCGSTFEPEEEGHQFCGTDCCSSYYGHPNEDDLEEDEEDEDDDSVSDAENNYHNGSRAIRDALHHLQLVRTYLHAMDLGGVGIAEEHLKDLETELEEAYEDS